MMKALYISLVVVLMFLISYIGFLFAFVFCLRIAVPVQCYARVSLQSGWCILPVWAQWSTVVISVASGIILGRTWWRIIYVEHRRWRPAALLPTKKR